MFSVMSDAAAGVADIATKLSAATTVSAGAVIGTAAALAGAGTVGPRNSAGAVAGTAATVERSGNAEGRNPAGAVFPLGYFDFSQLTVWRIGHSTYL